MKCYKRHIGDQTAGRREALFVFLLVGALGMAAKPGGDPRKGELQPGETSIVRIEAARLGLKDFKMRSHTENGRLVLDGFSASLGGGSISGNGHVNFAESSSQHEITVNFSDVVANAIFNAIGVNLDAKVSGHANGSISLRWNGIRGSEAWRTMSGKCSVRLGSGSVSNLPILEQIASVTGIQELSVYRFNSASADAVIADGFMTVNHIGADGVVAALSGNGGLNLVDNKLHLGFNLSVLPEVAQSSERLALRAASKLYEAMSESKEKGRLAKLPFEIVLDGDFKDPRFSLNFENQNDQRPANRETLLKTKPMKTPAAR